MVPRGFEPLTSAVQGRALPAELRSRDGQRNVWRRSEPPDAKNSRSGLIRRGRKFTGWWAKRNRSANFRLGSHSVENEGQITSELVKRTTESLCRAGRVPSWMRAYEFVAQVTALPAAGERLRTGANSNPAKLAALPCRAEDADDDRQTHRSQCSLAAARHPQAGV